MALSTLFDVHIYQSSIPTHHHSEIPVKWLVKKKKKKHRRQQSEKYIYREQSAQEDSRA